MGAGAGTETRARYFLLAFALAAAFGAMWAVLVRRGSTEQREQRGAAA